MTGDDDIVRKASQAAPCEVDNGLRVTRFELGGEEFAVLSFPVVPEALPEALSAAEAAVCRLILQGLSNAEIARERGTAVRTVANQIAAIFGKLGVASRAELIAQLHGGDAS